MVPANWRLIDLCESETTALIGIFDIGEVIVEVVEGVVSTSGRVDWAYC